MSIKQKTIGFLYRNFLKPVLFLIEPEKVHDFMVKMGEFLGKRKIWHNINAKIFNYQNSKLTQKVGGITFQNPVGLAAGFDKNGQLLDILPSIGFGFEEIGSITALPCEGNAKPRLWRLKKSKGLVVNYGLKSDGSEAMAKKLHGRKFEIPIGISIAKTNCLQTVDTAAGIEDYLISYRRLKALSDYITLNVSCPNAYGGQSFADGEKLEKLLTAVQKEGMDKPIFIKLQPGLTRPQLDQIVEAVDSFPVTGYICSNLAKDRSQIQDKILDKKLPPTGAISGKPVQDLSDELLKTMYQLRGCCYTMIGCGGIFTAEDAYRKIRLGASLVQIITGMIFQGPQVIGEINRGLVRLLERDGFTNISEAIGKDNPI